MKIKHYFIAILLIILLLIEGQSSVAQTIFQLGINQPAALIVNAGTDKNILTGSNTVLGGSPTANGGTGTLTYQWQPVNYLTESNTANPLSQPPSNITYYLTVTDQNGCISRDTINIRVGDEVGLDENLSDLFLDIYPNPNDGSFTLILHGLNSAKVNLYLIDVTGKPVYTNSYKVSSDELSIDIDIPDLATGYYILRISGEFGNVFKNIIIK